MENVVPEKPFVGKFQPSECQGIKYRTDLKVKSAYMGPAFLKNDHLPHKVVVQLLK
jgi:hypothetical protein